MQAQMIEQLSLENWPAIQQVQLNGWLLRTANGYTKRANCISTIQPSHGNIDEKITQCERYYEERSQATIFKITPFSDPRLDEKLNQRSYHTIDPSIVLSMPLSQFKAADMSVLADADEVDINMYEHISLKWIEQFIEVSEASSSIAPTLVDIMAAMKGQLLGCSVRLKGETVATGFAVIDQGFVSLYNVHTCKAERNKGFAGVVLTKLIETAMNQGAHSSYIAVLANNEPAKHLYSKLGYKELYRYSYRIK